MEFDVLHAKECVMELGYLPNVTQLDPTLQGYADFKITTSIAVLFANKPPLLSHV